MRINAMKLVMVGLCMFIWGGASIAGCLTTIPASSPIENFAVNGDGTVTDLKTGLMWKECTEGLSGVSCATGVASVYPWDGALRAVELVNASVGFAGFRDWRVPNIKELHSIVEDQCNLPAVNDRIFPATVNGEYWSSSWYAATASSMWAVSFINGGDNIYNVNVSRYIRLVRGGL